MSKIWSIEKQLQRKTFIGGSNRAYCGIRKASRDIVRRSLIGSKDLEGPSALGRLGLEGLLLFLYSNSFTSGWISVWRAAKRFR